MVKLTVFSVIASVLLIVPGTYAKEGHIEAHLGIGTEYTVPIEISGMVDESVLQARGVSSIFNNGFMISIGYVENGVVMWTSAPSYIPESWRSGLSKRHFGGVITRGPGSRGGVEDVYFALMWNEGGIWGYPVNASIYDDCGITVELEGCSFESLFDGEVELLFTDFHFESLLNDVIANLESTLYMVVKADEPNVIEDYLTVALVTDQLPLDTVYVKLDQVDSYEARGSVGPIRTLGEESQVHINGFGTVYGFVYKGDDPQSEDWVEAGHLRINVQGITPTTANSFLSISQFFCTAHFRDDKGNYIPLTGVESVEWSSGANNILSGSLSPETGSNETFTTYPDPHRSIPDSGDVP